MVVLAVTDLDALIHVIEIALTALLVAFAAQRVIGIRPPSRCQRRCRSDTRGAMPVPACQLFADRRPIPERLRLIAASAITTYSCAPAQRPSTATGNQRNVPS